MASIIEGKGRGKILTYNVFRYNKNRATNNKIHWRCALTRTCKGSLQTNIFDITDRDAHIDVLEVTIKQNFIFEIKKVMFSHVHCKYYVQFMFNDAYLLDVE